MTDNQLIALIVTISGFMVALIGFSINLWKTSKDIRAENKSDMREMLTLIDSNHKNVMNLIIAIKDEIKDFHGRLCAIEERQRKDV